MYVDKRRCSKPWKGMDINQNLAAGQAHVVLASSTSSKARYVILAPSSLVHPNWEAGQFSVVSRNHRETLRLNRAAFPHAEPLLPGALGRKSGRHRNIGCAWLLRWLSAS
jgi:hypothetical protein